MVFVASGAGLAGRLEGHHKQSLHRGGAAYNPANVETLCRNCHLEISIPSERLEWRRYLKTEFQEINQNENFTNTFYPFKRDSGRRSTS